jgi:hypothetical protein
MAAQTVDQNAIMGQQVDKRRLPPHQETVLVKIVLSFPPFSDREIDRFQFSIFNRCRLRGTLGCVTAIEYRPASRWEQRQ